MSVDIGPKIGIDGEAEFRANLTNINQLIKTLGSEMKAVTSAFTDNNDAQASLSAQAQVLTRQVEAQEKKLQELQKGLIMASEKYGETDTKTLKWAQAVNDAAAALNDLKSRLSQTESQIDSFGDGAESAKENLDHMAQASGSASDGFGVLQVAAGSLLANGITLVIGGIKDLISELWNLDEATEEYRNNMALLTTAYGVNGFGADAAAQAYKDLYAIIGDEGTAAEAAQLMATLSQHQQDLSVWTDIAAGVWGTFGEALPINSLMEAANESAKTGQVVGVLADALNWAGISEDSFNASLSQAGGEAQRNALIMGTLAMQYSQAADAFYQNNAAVIESREAQADLDDTTAELGETISGIKTELLQAFLPALQTAADAAVDFLSDVDAEEVAQTIISLANAFIKLSPVIAAATAGMLAYKAASAVSGLISALTGTLGGATTATQAFNAALNANPIVAIITIVATLVSALITLIATNEDVRKGFLAVWDAITGALGEAWNVIQGIIDKIKNAFGGLVDGVKELLGIHSPSKVFKDIGENMAEGTEIGWENQWNRTGREIETSLDFSRLELAGSAMQSPANVVYVDRPGAETVPGAQGGFGSRPERIDITLELDGQKLARKTYDYNRRENLLRGNSLVEVGSR